MKTKAIKAWAVVSKSLPHIYASEVYSSKFDALMRVEHDQKVIPVEIRPLTKGRQKHGK